MAINELKTFVARCDFCRKRVEYQALAKRLPEGWGKRERIRYGSDHYYKDGYIVHEDACPTCMQKGKKKK